MPDGASLHGQLARLLMQHRTALYSYIFACMRNHHDAEDLLQEVSVVVLESGEQLKSADGFLPWAREIARRRVLARRRASGREVATDPELAACLADAAERVEQAQPTPPLREALRACLEQLPRKTREVLLLRYATGLQDVTDLERRIGLTVQAAYALVKRAKAALRDCVRRRLAAEARP